MTELVSLLIMLVLAAGFSAWVALGLGGLVGLTVGVAEFCQSLFVKCLAYSNMGKVGFFWLGAVVFAAGLSLGLYKGARGLLRATRALKSLPVRHRAGHIVLIDDIENRIAFTHGLIRPRIYLSRGLIRGLDHDELKGVFLHELHHLRGRDPLKFFLAGLLKDAFFYIPLAATFFERVQARGEDAADRRAAGGAHGALSLASALVKVARHAPNPNLCASTALTGSEGSRAGSIEARVRRLLDGGRLDVAPPRKRSVAASLLVALLLLASFALPLSTVVRPVEACTTEHCSAHIDKLGDDCARHCELHPLGKHTH